MRFPSFTPDKSPRLVYVKGAEARMSSNDEPDWSEQQLIAGDKERAEFYREREQDRAMQEQIHRMRCLEGQ